MANLFPVVLPQAVSRGGINVDHVRHWKVVPLPLKDRPGETVDVLHLSIAGESMQMLLALDQPLNQALYDYLMGRESRLLQSVGKLRDIYRDHNLSEPWREIIDEILSLAGY